jgi:hypothetical protein
VTDLLLRRRDALALKVTIATGASVLRSSIITYDGLPISRGGAHGLRTRSPKAALKQVRDFLRNCTDTSIPLNVFVEVIAGPGLPNAFLIPLIERLTTKLGTPIRRHAGAKDVAHRWTLRADQVEEYVTLVERACPLPVHPFGVHPFVVAVLFNFRLVSPETNIVLPSQDAESYGGFSPNPGQLLGQSQLYARISEHSTVALFLNFPFEELSDSFLAAAAYIQANLPFLLSPNHWKQWRLRGTGYSGRRVRVQVA